MKKQFLTAPAAAKILGTAPLQILRFIERGELRAVNTSLGTRPRWKIAQEDFEAFCRSRTNTAALHSKQPRRITLPKAKRNFLDD